MEDMAERIIVELLDDIKSTVHDLTLDELDALINDLTVVYERYGYIIDMRKGGQQ
jgi:hypothetical protein